MHVRLAIVLACVPAIAHAGSHCHEVSHVVGYEQCSRFGATWTQGASFGVESGPVLLHFAPGRIDAFASGGVHLTTAPGDDRAITATGVGFRELAGWHAGYLGFDFAFASFSDGPGLVVDASPRGGTMQSGTTGSLGEARFLIGYRQVAGPVDLGLELAPGMRVAAFDTMAPMTAHTAVQLSGIVEVHARVETWVSPHWTLAAIVGTNVLAANDISGGLMLGLHVSPFDSLR